MNALITGDIGIQGMAEGKDADGPALASSDQANLCLPVLLIVLHKNSAFRWFQEMWGLQLAPVLRQVMPSTRLETGGA
jgi:hypothetical protein